MKKVHLFALLIALIGQTVLGQNVMDDIIQNHLQNLITKSNLTTEDISEWKITNVVPSLNPEIQHVYVQQY